MSEVTTVRLSEAKKYMRHHSKKKQPVMIWGPPGVGKSEIVESIVKDILAGGRRAKLYDMRLSMCEPTDIMGIPYFDSGTNIDASLMTALFQEVITNIDRDDKNAIATAKASFELKCRAMFGDAVGGQMKWAPPSLLPKQSDINNYDLVVLFLDELNGAAPAVQAAAYQLILNRRVGDYKLPDNVAVFAAGNRESDKGVTYRMPKPLANRFLHYEVRVNFDDWVEWATDNGVSAEVVGYLTYRKEDLMKFDPRSADRSFPTPRSWTFVSEMLEDLDPGEFSETEQADMINAAIGEGTGLQFSAHRKIASQLPDPQMILKGQVKDLKTKEMSAMYSLATSLAYELREAQGNVGRDGFTQDDMNVFLDNVISFWLKHFQEELTVMSARMILKYKVHLAPKKLKNWDAFFDRFGELVRNA